MVAQAQLDTDIAKEIVESIRFGSKSGDKSESDLSASSADKYYEEKMAQKMLDFFEHEEKILALYAEAKESYPIMAELMENKRPYLKQVLDESRKLYEKSLLEK